MAYELIIGKRRLPEGEPPQDEPNSSDERPRTFKSAANDNDIEWPLLPVPDGWLSS